MKYSPTKVILFFFLMVIVAGTALLSLPFSRTDTREFSLLSNLFMSTSAVCVTGLSVVDLGKYYTLFGQLVVLLLIQVGGLGYMTLSTMIGMLLGRIALKERVVIKEILDVSSFAGLLSLLKRIVVIVLLFEGIGAVILTAAFLKDYSFPRALYYGVFHAVSGFCNAGLSPFAASLEGYAGSWTVPLTIAGLIITGGLGFLVLVELWEIIQRKMQRTTLHTRIVLVTTAALIVTGMALFWIFEANNVLHGKGAGYSLLNSFFQSVTTRTAGFDTISVGLCHKATALMMMVLMFIGASPGGTGGGIKTTTFVIVLLFVLSMVKDRPEVNLKGRHIADDIIRKALVIFILSLFVVVGSTILILIVDPRFLMLDALFEVTSAFGTVGLSRGITASLGDASKLVIIITMIIGRIGPLTFLMAILKRHTASTSVRFPEAKVLIG